jgi:uncharacterized protein (TIGR03437 family)
MQCSHFFRTAALATAILLSGTATLVQAQPNGKGKPEDKGKPDNGGNENKPAKVTWSPKRVEIEDVAEMGEDEETIKTIEVEVTADKEVMGATLFASGSLRSVIGLPGPFDITCDPDCETVTLQFELIMGPDEAGRTIGGTVQVMAGGKHLAQPLAFSLKRLLQGGDNGADSDDRDDELMDDDGTLPVSWLLDGEDDEGGEEGEDREAIPDITFDLFDSDGKARIIMRANRDLENLGLWFTPSSSACITALFDEMASTEGVLKFDDDGNIIFIKAGTEVAVLLQLSNREEWTCGGGTLHVRSVAGNSRSYPQIVGVRIDKGDGVEEEPEEVAPLAIVDAASFEEEPIAALQIISIFGLGLGEDDPAALEFDEDGNVSQYLDGTMVLFDGYPAPLLSVSAGQINAIVPSAVKGGDVELQVLRGGKQSAPFPVPLGPPTPSLFTLSGNQAAAINADGTLNTNVNPARGGTVVSLFGTGGGPTVTPLPDGAVATEAIWLSGAVRIYVGGVEANVRYAGTAPGLVAAAVQFNIQLNPQTPKGKQPVVITIDGVESNGTATIFVQ